MDKKHKQTQKHITVSVPKRQILTGVVVSRKMEKTAVVLVTRYVAHKKYKKHQKLSKRYLVHDEKNTSQVGDKVTIISVRPMSRNKHFALSETLGRVNMAPQIEEMPIV